MDGEYKFHKTNRLIDLDNVRIMQSIPSITHTHERYESRRTLYVDISSGTESRHLSVQLEPQKVGDTILVFMI